MTYHDTSEELEWVGVIGAGSFGTAMAQLLAENRRVLLYVRRPQKAEQLRRERTFRGHTLHERITITEDLERLPKECTLLFPVVPAASFRDLLTSLSPLLRPYHIVLHATKGLDIQLPEGKAIHELETLEPHNVQTMSELIRSETLVERVGAIAGPNLASELLSGGPAATVVASRFDEVIREGQSALRSRRFRVHGSHDLIGIELAGVLKNTIAIGAGIITGLEFGDNTRALLITHGMAEMANVGKALGADPRAFLGLAGIGDLVATCSSPLSRNFSVGYRLAKGETLGEIMDTMEETAEGINTICIVRALSNYCRIPTPITTALFRTLFEGLDMNKGVDLLMEYPFTQDVAFI